LQVTFALPQFSTILTVKMHIIREMCDVETIIGRNDRCLRARTSMSFKNASRKLSLRMP